MGPRAADIYKIIPEVRNKLPDLEPASPLEPEQASAERNLPGSWLMRIYEHTAGNPFFMTEVIMTL